MAANTIAAISALPANSGRNFIKPQKPRKGKTLENFADSYSSLAAGFGVSEGEIKDWLKNEYFAPFWNTYLKDYLEPARQAARDAGNRSFAGPGIKAAISRLQQGERQGMSEYSPAQPDKRKSTDLDPLALLLSCVQREKKKRRSGIFYGKRWPVEQEYHAIWQAKHFMTNQTNDTQTRKREEAERKRQHREALRQLQVDLGTVGTGRPDPSDQTSAPLVSTNTAASAGAVPTGSESSLSNPAPTGAPAATGNADVRERSPKRIKTEDNTAESDNPRDDIVPSGLNPDDAIMIDSDDEYDEEGIHEQEQDPDDKIVIPPTEVEDDNNAQADQPEENVDTASIRARQEQADPADRTRQRSPTIGPEPPQSDWAEVLAEAAGTTYDLSIRFWQIQTVQWLIQPEKMPRFAEDILANLAPDQIDTLSQMSQAWYRESQELTKKNTIPDSNVNDEDRRNFALGEEFLNTTPDIVEDIDNAMVELGMTYPDPRPRFKANIATLNLLPLQVVGILHLVRMRRSLKAAILADATGLGKTFQMLGVFLQGVEQYQTRKAAALASNEPAPPAKPALVLVPPHLIEQTYSEITSVLEDPRDVYIYYGDPRAGGSRADRKIPTVLTRDHDFFLPGQYGTDPSTRIVISTPSTFALRHGPRAYGDWLVQSSGMAPAEAKKIRDSPTSDCPAILNGLFDFVACDECHVAKNSTSEINKVLRALDPDFTLLMSATPGINSISDYEGYFKMIQPRNPPMGSDGSPITRPDSVNHNPFQDEEEGDLLLRINPILLKRYIFEHNDDKMAAVNLRKALELCMVRRTYNTSLNGKTVGKDMPKVFRLDLEAEYDESEKELYDKYAEKHYKRLFIPLKDGQIGMNMGKARHLSLNSTWIGYEYVSDLMKAEKIPDLKKEKYWLHRMLTVLKKKREENNEPVGWSVPDKSDLAAQTAIVLRESPKFQAFLGLCADRIIRQKKKVIVFCNMPAQQILATEILRSVGIDAHMLSADLSVTQRAELVEKFTATDEVQALVMTYSVGLCGLNLQARCADAIHIDVPSSRDVRMQADGRIRRYGQKYNVRSWSITTKRTFNDHQHDNLRGKGMTGILTELNSHLFDFTFADDEAGQRVPVIRGWVVCDGRLCKAGDASVRADAKVEQADLDRIAQEVYLLEKGRTQRVG